MKTNSRIQTIAAALLFAAFSTNAVAINAPEQDTASIGRAQQKLDSVVNALHYQTGIITIGDNLAKVETPDGFSFLGPKDARFVLKDLWGNPDDDKVFGLLVPKNVSLIDSNGWAVVYSYEESGHVKDDDAAAINYDDLLDEMKKQTIAASVERKKMGYKSIELVGWAEKPYYDKDAHKLHWAKEIKFENSISNTLNYNIRMLGRKGVLVMNIVADMKGLPVVESNINKVLGSTNFTDGNTYNDFNSSTDKIAEYGIGGLIAGGVLLKTGLLAKIGLLLLKGWKLIAVAVAGIFATVRKKLFGKKKKAELPQVKEEEQKNEQV